MKQYHALIVLLLLLGPCIYSGWSNYNDTRKELLADMNQALEKTIVQQSSIEITPDTIRNYLTNLTVPELREQSFVYYAMDDRRESLCSRRMRWSNGVEDCEFRSYASCSFLTILMLSDQRWATVLLMLSLLWVLASAVYFKRDSSTESVVTIGGLSLVEDRFYNAHRQPVHLTPMQEQLLKLFFAAPRHSLSKQEICDSLWPRKPDASDTLYTLVKRLKPVLEEQGSLQITSDRGKGYVLEDM